MLKLFKSLQNAKIPFSTCSKYFSTSAAPSNLTESKGEFKSTLMSKIKISSDTFIFKFDLPHKELTLGLLPGQHVKIHMMKKYQKKDKIKEEDISRKYTPISPPELAGSFDMLIKLYNKTEKYPEGGEMSELFDKMQPGDQVGVSGPTGRTIYWGNGEFSLEKHKTKVDHIGFVIGGSGITPAYQIMKKLYNNKDDPTRAYLLYANKTEEDILLKEELDRMAEDSRFKVYYTVDKASSKDWTGFEGYVTKEMMKKVFPDPSDKILMTFCGNKYMKKLVFDLFEQLGYNEDLTARY